MSEKIKTLRGVFKDNYLHLHDSDEKVRCLTYKSVRDKIEGKPGFFNLQQNKYKDWIIFQWILEDWDYPAEEDKEEVIIIK